MRGLTPAKGGDSVDAFSKYSRRLIYWKRGELRKIKRREHKKERAHGRRMIREEDA